MASKTFSSTVIADSVSRTGSRLTSLEITFPRVVAAELNTHKVLAKNAASSRARPPLTVLRDAWENPYVPNEIGVNQSGMVAGEALDGKSLKSVQEQILRHRDRALVGAFENLLSTGRIRSFLGEESYARLLIDGFQGNPEKFELLEDLYRSILHEYKIGNAPYNFYNVHKQIVNRYLEPWLWHTVLVTGTEWDNFVALRANPGADPAIRQSAEKVVESLNESQPQKRYSGEWHLPFIQESDIAEVNGDIETLKKISAGRSARLSYLTHHNERSIEKDISLSKRLYEDGHMSPFEHQARPLEVGEAQDSTLLGWKQYRKELPNENIVHSNLIPHFDGF